MLTEEALKQYPNGDAAAYKRKREEFILPEGRRFPYIGTPLEARKPIAKQISNLFTDPFRMLDVGCGYGHFLMDMKNRIPHAQIFGLDVDEIYVKVAKAHFPCICMNAFSYKAYDQYDLVYMFRPMPDDDAYKNFVNHILKHMRIGAYMLQYWNPVIPDGKHFVINREYGFLVRKD